MSDKHLALQFADGSHHGHRIVRLTGSLCLETVSQFLERMRQEPAPVIILVLRDIDFLDSTGVGAIVRIHVGSENAQRRLGLADMSVRARAALEVAGLLTVLSTFPTVAEAEKHFG
jgi:anti-anti-sigma factor